jgi:hypothetical protein
VPVVRTHHKEPEPDLLVQLPDGSHTIIEIGITDYAGQGEDTFPVVGCPHLLDFDGLCQVAGLVERLRSENPPAKELDRDNIEDTA